MADSASDHIRNGDNHAGLVLSDGKQRLGVVSLKFEKK
jgi:hypothetical protein